MALTVQVVLASAAGFASERISGDDAKRDFLARFQGLEVPCSGKVQVITNGALAKTVLGTDATSRYCEEWSRTTLPGLNERFAPSLVGWQLHTEPLIETVDLRGESFDCRVLASLAEMTTTPSDLISSRDLVLQLFSTSVLNRLHEFADGVATTPAILIRGFYQLEALPAALLGIGALIGKPYAEQSENSQLIQHIRPLPEFAFSQTSASSEAPLLDHVENVGTVQVPDWVGIGCIKNREMAETTILHPVKAIYSMIQAGLIAEVACLFDNQFWVRNPESFGGERTKRYGMRVLTGPYEHPKVQADFADMGSDSARHADAFELFRQHCGIVRETVCLEAGDILLLRNTGSETPYLHPQSMHGRGGFKAFPEPGEERYLLRVFIRENDYGNHYIAKD